MINKPIKISFIYRSVHLTIMYVDMFKNVVIVSHFYDYKIFQIVRSQDQKLGLMINFQG